MADKPGAAAEYSEQGARDHRLRGSSAEHNQAINPATESAGSGTTAPTAQADEPSAPGAQSANARSEPDSGGAPAKGSQGENGGPPKQRPGWFKILLFGALILALVVGIPWGLNYWRFATTHISTDDAYVTGNLVIVSPVISGTLEKLTVDEGSLVHKGDLIARISDRSPTAMLRQARANYQAALSQIPQAERNLIYQKEQTQAAIRKAQSALEAQRARAAGAQRQVALTTGTTQSQIRQAESQVSAAQAAQAQSQAQAKAADVSVDNYRQAVQTALASLDNYQQQVLTAQKAVQTAQARVQAAQSDAERATKDEARYRVLYSQDAVSAQVYDNARAQARTAQANVEATQSQVDAAQSQVEQAKAGVRQAQSQVEQARKSVVQAQAQARAAHRATDAAAEQVGVARAGVGLARANSGQVGIQQSNLLSTQRQTGENAADVAGAQAGEQQVEIRRRQIGTYRAQAEQALEAMNNARITLNHTYIYAPNDGTVVKTVANVGSSMAPGQTILTMTQGDYVWVQANLKETQLRNVRPGEAAEVEADGVPGRIFKGVVKSINSATGAATSLLPPDNATGNFTKVVQRVPVRIELVAAEDDEDRKYARRKELSNLRQGMSVTAVIDISKASGASHKAVVPSAGAGVFAASLRTIQSALLPAACSLLPAAFAVVPGVCCLFSAQQQTPRQDEPLPIKPPPVPGGVIPLPQGPPPTGQQAPVPSPARPLPAADKPLMASPDLRSVNGFVEGRAITLSDAIAVALYTNREFAGAAASLEQARGRTGQARSMLNPTAGVNGQLTEYDAPTTANLGAFGGGQGSGGTTAPPFVIVPQFNPVFTASVSLPLDIAGTLHSAVSQAQFQEVAARIDINRVRNDVVYSVKVAFYNVFRAQSQIAVATEALNNSLGRLSDANKNYAAGTAPRFDVISAQRDVADAQQGLINARAQLSVNLASLKNTMGVDIKARVRLSSQNAVDYPPGVEPPPINPAPNPNPVVPPGPIETPAPRQAVQPGAATPGISVLPSTNEADDNFDFGPEYDSLIREAVGTRPEALEGDAQIAAARRGVQYARRSSLPALNVGLSDVYSPNAAGFTRRNEAAVSLGVTLPIFDGGLARERVREARGAEANAEINRRRALDQVQLDVQQAYIALVQARNRVAVANVGLAQAREANRLAQVRYNAGVSQQTGISPQLELSNAQNTLTQALTSQVNALYDYNSARAQVDRAVGRYSFTGSGPGYPAPPPPGVRGGSR